MKMKYTGENLNEISFPIGGIGTGCIGLGGDGRLKEWEIFNHPDKGRLNGYSHLAIRAEKGGKVLDARVLNSDLAAPYTGQLGDFRFSGFGHGPFRQTMAGMPHFKSAEFEAQYPFARIAFDTDDFPGQVEMTAFNPLIPLNDEDSSLPAAFFEVKVTNPGAEDMDYAVAFSLSNPFPQGESRCETAQAAGYTGLKMFSAECDREDLKFGDLFLVSDAEHTSLQQYWFRGYWFDNLTIFWQDFCRCGELKNRVYEGKTERIDKNIPDTGTLAAHLSVPAGESRRVRFALCWSFPNTNIQESPDRLGKWKNYYATRFENSVSTAEYVMREWERLEKQTRSFTDVFFSQTLPEEAVDAISANISILKSPTCLRLEDGTFYGWEGCHTHSGSCEGSCSHVWNYAYALPFLFPKLERSMREADFTYNQDEAGGMQFRLMLPIGTPRRNFHPCCDGQFGGVIKTYREWKICGDDAWLKKWWPAVQKSLEYAWSAENPDLWDPQGTGVLTGRQHHTLDMELFGPNSWLTSMYLAALKAAAEMAEYLGEKEAAEKYREKLKNGAKFVNENLFNGEYFYQEIPLEDKSFLAPFETSGVSLQGDGIYDAYWNEEAGEIKYQIGEGCAIDQVLGQWHAQMCGLGDVLDREKVKSALASIYRYNYKKDMRKHINPCRMYFMADEQAAVICEWPQGRRKPVVAAPYAEESFHGTEYQAAAHMISQGLVEEGMEIVRAVRNRYDGKRRNPFNEFECGSNYARSMASYALLIAFAGFEYHASLGYLAFRPVREQEREKYFFSLDGGWGFWEKEGKKAKVFLCEGEMKIRRLGLAACPEKILYQGEEIAFEWNGESAVLRTEVGILKNEALEIIL